MGQDPFTGLASWEHLIPLSAPFLWKLAPLVALERPHLLLTVFLSHTLPLSDSHWLLPPSSLSWLDCPSTIFWALRFLYHKFDVLIHMLMTLKLYLEQWQLHWATNPCYKYNMFNYVQILFLLWIIISTFPTPPQPSRYSSEIEKKFYIFRCTKIQHVQRRSPSWLCWLGCDGCSTRPGEEWTRRNESRKPISPGTKELWGKEGGTEGAMWCWSSFSELPPSRGSVLQLLSAMSWVFAQFTLKPLTREHHLAGPYANLGSRE